MPTEANTALSDEQIAEIEARKPFRLRHGQMVQLTPAERDALCATVKALRVENERLQELLTTEVAKRIGMNAERLERSQKFTQAEIIEHCSDDRPTDDQRGSYQG